QSFLSSALLCALCETSVISVFQFFFVFLVPWCLGGSALNSRLAVAVRLGGPGEQEHQRAQGGDEQEGDEGRVPAAVVGEPAQAHARGHGAEVAEQACESDGG